MENTLNRIASELVTKSFLFAELFNAQQLKRDQPELYWLRQFSGFLELTAKLAAEHHGRLLKVVGDGAVAVFDHPDLALACAVGIQRELLTLRRDQRDQLAAKITLATGRVLPWNGGTAPDYIGTAAELVIKISQRTCGNAIILDGTTRAMVDSAQLPSYCGGTTEHHEWFAKLTNHSHPELALPVDIYTLRWQISGGEYLSTMPVEPATTHTAPQLLATGGEPTPEENRVRGRVSAIKRSRGFGFIQYVAETGEYKEIYAHLSYVINQVPLKEGDEVQFVIRPGKGGRPQACSILVLGSTLHGQVEEFDSNDGAGFVTIRDFDSGQVRFYLPADEVNHQGLTVNDVVEFTVCTDQEGLIATNVRPYQGSSPSGHVGLGDNLAVGSVEQGVVNVYFPDRGYGFALCRRNDVYFNVGEFVHPELDIHKGDLIEFTVTPGRDGAYRAGAIRLISRAASAMPAISG